MTNVEKLYKAQELLSEARSLIGEVTDNAREEIEKTPIRHTRIMKNKQLIYSHLRDADMDADQGRSSINAVLYHMGIRCV